RLVLPRARACMRAREDCRRRLPHQLLDGELRIGALPQGVRPVLDVRLHQRAVLVQRGLRVRGVFLEGEGQLVAALDVGEQRAKGSEAESSQRLVQVRSTYRHDFAYAAAGSSPF